jgi:predicted GIY-YIG superfamily endonuclease
LHSSPDDAIVVVMHCVYILRCADGSLYVGSTDDVELRLRRHTEGRGAAFIAQRRPVTLAYSESHPTLLAARRREAQVKRWTPAKKAALIAGDGAKLNELARRHRWSQVPVRPRVREAPLGSGRGQWRRIRDWH